MNITLENIDELNAIIKINIEKNDYEPQVEKVLKDYQKKANMQGFRPGKVPMGIIHRRYRGAVMVDEMNKIVSENLNKYISENQLSLLGEPLPNESQKTLDLENSENFELAFDIALSPKFEINLTKKDIIPFYNITVTDEMVENDIKNNIKRFGKKEQPEITGENSVLKGSFIQVDKEGNEVENGIKADDSTLSVAVVKNEKAKKQLIGKAINESVIIDLRKAFPNDTELSYLLKIKKEEVENVKGNFKFSISEISDFVDAEINQELFDKVFGVGIVTSEDEMKVKTKENLEKLFLIESEYKFQKDSREYLFSKHNIKLPEEFLKRWMKMNAKDNKELSDEEMQTVFADLKWQLIVSEIIQTNSLEVNDIDVENYAIKSVKMQFMQYGLSNIPDEYIKSYAVDSMKDEKNNKNYYNGAMFDKMIDYLKNAVTLEEKVISRDEFNEVGNE